MIDLVDIKDLSDNIRFSTPINEGSKRKFLLMKEDYITLKFSLDKPIYFKLGDFVVDTFGLFELVDLQKPTFNNSTGGYDYELRLDAYYWKWKNKIFKFTPESVGQEASWNLTASLDVQADIVLRNLKALGYTYKRKDFEFSMDNTVENKAQLMSYDNINILDSLFEMAKKWDCECWITDHVIHFGRCEFGTSVDFELGKNVESMTCSESQSNFATRIYAFGSTRNIPTNYRPVDESVVVNGITQKRLMLPVGTPYIDAYPNMSTEEAVEDVIVLDDVYPRRIGSVSDITTHEYKDIIKEEGKPDIVKKWNAYRFKDASITFSKDYVLEGQELKIIFQSGALNGMEFAVTFNPCDKEGGETPIPEKDEDGSWNLAAQVWEIVRNENYGRPLPDDVLCPQGEHMEGNVLVLADTYILSGFDTKFVSDAMIPAAEQELKEKTEKRIAKSKIDPSTYENKMMSDHMVNEDGTLKLFEAGDRVNLINSAYFETGNRQSRIIGFEYNLDIPYDSPVYTVGETASYSRISDLEGKVESLTYKGQTYTGSGGSGVYVIGTNDSTNPTNRNVYSALNSDSRYISKKHDDIAKGHITFEQGIYVKGGTAGDDQSILEEDNSIIEEGNGIIEESLSAPAPLTSTLGSLDNVDDIVDVPSNKDVILIKKAGSSEWTQEDKAVSDTILEAPKDGKQYARQDGEWSIVEASTANVPEWALQPEKPAYTALEVGALSLNGGKMNKTNLVIDLNANLLDGKKASDFSLKIDLPTKLSQLTNDANYVQDANYVHTDNNFTSLLKGQLSDLNIEYLNAANKLNYQRAKTFFSKTHADTSSVWAFVRYLNNLPTLTSTQVKIVGVRSDFNGDQISDSYVNLPGATQTLAGIMTAADKTKLDGIAIGATKVIVDSTMSETSLNPVQNKIITSRFIQVEGRATNLENQYSALSNTLSPISVSWNKRGTKDGFLILGENGIISSKYLPSYVDDVVEVYPTYDKSPIGVLTNIKLYTDVAHTTAVVPESGMIYVEKDESRPQYQFRWSGTNYIQLSSGGLILGTIAGTAFEGNKGNVLYTNFGEGDNLLYTQKARDFFKSLAVGVSFISNLEVGTVSETSANLVYDSNVFGATTNRITIALPVADSKEAGIMSAYDKIFIDDIKSRSDKFVTLDTNQTITGVKRIKNDLHIDAIDSERKIILNNGNIRMLPYASGSSFQGLFFCNSSNSILGTLGSYITDNSLNYLYIGTGYEDSKNWITFTPTKTTIKNKAEIKGSLTISEGVSGQEGLVDTSNRGIVMYSGSLTYLGRAIGGTYIRSGNDHLYHLRENANYVILDAYNTPNPFCYRGSASVDHVDLASTSAGATGFVNYNSGTYMVSRGGSTAMYIKFQGAGSTSGLELYTNYLDGSPLQFRKIVDNNRISGVWSTILDQKNWASFITFDKLSDKPLISVDMLPNSLVKRTTNGFILGGNAGITFTDTSKNSDAKNAWVISTNTSYGNANYDLKISQYIVGTKGRLLLNGVPVATTGNRYIMTLYPINASGLDENTYYPVTIPLFSGGNFRIEVLTSLNGIVPSWSTHASGFTVRFIEEVQGSGWGATPVRRRILDSVHNYVRDVYPPIGKVTQMSNSSTEVIWVRGGGLYYFYTSGTGSNLIIPVLRKTSYTGNSQTVSPIPVADKDDSIVRNMVMNDDAVYTSTTSTIVRRDPNGYINGVRFYTTTPVEDNYAISHVPYFYNSDGFIRKCTIDRFNRQLSFNKLIILTAGSNELNFIPDNYNNSLWFNYKTCNGNTNANIQTYVFGDGAGWYTNVTSKGFIRYGSTDRYALTGAGGHLLIDQQASANSVVQRGGGGEVYSKSYLFTGSNTRYNSYSIELYGDQPYIDFHYQGSAADYTSRIIESGSGHLNILADSGITVTGSIVSNIGFYKANSNNNYVLLGGGSHKLVNDFVDRTTNQLISGVKTFYSTDATGSYTSRAVELREVNLNGSSNLDPKYSPALGFHWAGQNASVISMHKDGSFYFADSNSGSTNYKYLYCNGIVKSGSSNDSALTGGGGHITISEEISSNTLAKRTGAGHIKVNDVISSSYQLHTDIDNPYLKLSAAGNNYFIQAAASGIWMGPSATDKSLIINSVGNAGLGILPNNTYKLYVNGNIRSSQTINAGEAVDMGYGYINVARPGNIENAACFSCVREGQMAFSLGYNSSNQIVLGAGLTNKTINPWLKIGSTSSTFAAHLNTKTTSTEYGEFNHDLGRMLSTTPTIIGTICITLPAGWVNSMNMYEIYVYEYNNEGGGNRILVSGYNYNGNSQWVNYKYTSEGNYYKGVRLGYRNGRCCILLGNTSTIWAYPQVFLANVYNGYSGLGSWKNGYTIGIITSESDVTSIVTVARSYARSDGFIKDGSNDNYTLLGGGGHLRYTEAADGSTLVLRNVSGYIYGSYFNQSSSVDSSKAITNIIFESGDGFFRKATLGRVTDTMRVATQTVKGLMSAEDKKKVDLFDPTKFLRRDIDDDALGHITFHKGIYVDGGSYDGQSIMEADGVNGIMEADGVNGIMEYSAPVPVAVSMTLGELTNVSSSVNTATSSKVMFVKGAGESVWTQETIIPNVLYGFSDTRSVATTPNDYNKRFTVVGLKANSAIGSPSSDSYSYVIGYRGWSDNLGGNAHEIAFNNQGISRRIGATDSWGGWFKLLDSNNWSGYITIPTALKNPNAITFTGAVTGTYDGSAAKTVNIPTMPDLGPYALKDFSNVTTQSLGKNGYCKFPNGLLIQWGKNTAVTPIRLVAFPVPFLDINYVVTANTNSSSVTKEVSDIRIGNKTTEAFAARIPTILLPTESTSSEDFEWMAIGRWK